MPTCLQGPERNDRYDNVAMAIEQTRVVFAQVLAALKQERSLIRCALAFRIKGDAAGVTLDKWPAALDPMRAAFTEMLGYLDKCVAIAEGEIAAPLPKALDDRLAALEQRIRELQAELGRE